MNDNTESHDSRFDDAEAEVTGSTPWMFREADAPNPLTIEATEWTEGVTTYGPVEFLHGADREFLTVDVQGRVKPGEVVSIRYVDNREGANGPYPDFRVSRKPPRDAERDSPDSEFGF
jgi:hypothetical protein